MSIGRIEMVDGVKKYVRYATLGGSGGVPVGDVKNISLEEGMDALTLKWSDPDNVVFNGETTAEWAGTKVIRKEGENPTSVDDGVLVTDSTVRNQYETDGFADSNVSNQVKYHYALFPYTTKNVYRMSDANRVNGTLAEYLYDRILSNNTWAEISDASQAGIAKEIWNIGDEKDGYEIVGFDHDDLANGSGKAGITFALKDFTKTTNTKWVTSVRTYFTPYTSTAVYNVCANTYNDMQEDLRSVIKTVLKRTIASASFSSSKVVVTYADLELNCFAFSVKEIYGETGFKEEGDQYTGFDWMNVENDYWTRSVNPVNVTYNGTKRQDSFYYAQINYPNNPQSTISYDSPALPVRYGFCI